LRKKEVSGWVCLHTTKKPVRTNDKEKLKMNM
jgi:hypothetical protein